MSVDDEKSAPVESGFELDKEDSDVDESSKLLSSREEPPSKTEDADNGHDDSEVPVISQFEQPAPSPLKRFFLIVFLFFIFWLAFVLQGSLLEAKRKPKVVHASRYSKEHRFRPAASPIITETLKDGRIRLRGALPTEEPKPVSKKPVRKRGGVKKANKVKRKTGKKA